MKKYLFGLAAIVIAISFSAFTSKTTTETFYPFLRPVNDDATVEDNSNWTTKGGLTAHAACDIDPNNIACFIEAEEQYYHLVEEGEDIYYVLNDETYAVQNNAEFLTITAADGLNVTSGPLTGQYKIIANDGIESSDNLDEFSFDNARLQVE